MTGTKDLLILQDRDRLLLRELAVMRIIDRELAKRIAGFRSTTRANARLLKLVRGGYLRRFFVGSVAAGRKAIYTLASKGAVAANTEYHRLSRSRGNTLVGDLYVAHQMRINEIYVSVKHNPLPDGLRLVRWMTFRQPLSEHHKLIPDAYFEIGSSGEITPMFLEVDLGTESMPVWDRKVQAYLDLAVSGDFTKRMGRSRFRVLVVTISPRRLSGIRATVAKKTGKIFWLSDFESLTQENFWLSIWRRPLGDQQLSLL